VERGSFLDPRPPVAKAAVPHRGLGPLGVGPSRADLIKLASTWEGIPRAERLEREASDEPTLLFSSAAGKACADAGVS
jgi:hypothetical protein